MPLPPEGTSHAILLVDIPLGKEQCIYVKVLTLHMAMAKKQSVYIPQKPHVKVHHTSLWEILGEFQTIFGKFENPQETLGKRFSTNLYMKNNFSETVVKFSVNVYIFLYRVSVYVSNFRMKYEDSENINTDHISIVIFNLHQIKQRAFFLGGHPIYK